MNELMNSGALNIAALVLSLLVTLVGLVVWFFVNRASVRANEQIALLEALLEQQKRQNALLRRLCDANEPEAASAAPAEKPQSPADDFVRLVAER
ncbi:YebO family protein [Franconibacter helveticus 513]|uniref:YebO family protein n=1 Tax=Franconibacter helveticus TaxID=357240 RepID=UPI0003FB64D6|nr:YebO family protein [Franconibacter helveticus]